MKRFLLTYWFLLALASVLAVGIGFGPQLKWLADYKWLRDGIVASVLFLMALPLEAGAMWRTVRRPWGPLLAVAVNFGLLPLFAWSLSGLLSADLSAGLLVAACTPCTLASVSVWTRRAGGNDAIAIVVTVVTNLACFIVTPLWLQWMTGSGAVANAVMRESLGNMIGQLAVQVVLPMVLAQIVRLYRPLGRWSTQHKFELGLTAQCGILCMVLMGAIQTGDRLFGLSAVPTSLFDFLLMVAVVLTVHVAMFWCGFALARLCGLTRGDQIAVAFAGSQKTLMVGLQVSMALGASILPMITYHVGQLLIDTVFADRLAKKSDPSAAP